MLDDGWSDDRAERREITNRALFAVARRQAGRISRDQLRWMGWSEGQIDRRVRSGLLTPLGTGVHAVGGRACSSGTSWSWRA